MINQDSLFNYSFRIADDILFRHVDSEAVLLHIPSGTYYCLSETSILFWEAIQTKQSFESVLNRVLDEYEVEESKVLAELQIFLQTLLDNNLISIAET